MLSKRNACALITLVAIGCGEAEPTESCPTGGAGTLQLEISGLPASAAARVTLTNGSDSRDASAGGAMAELPSGLWTISPDPVAVSGGLIRAAYDAPPQTVCVRDGETSDAEVAYAPIPSSQKLWVSSSNGAAEVQAYAAGHLGSSGTVSAAVLLASKPAIPRASGIAFDRRGNLWMAVGSGELRRYPANQLGASGEKTPDVVITGEKLAGGVPGPISIAFDAAGNLWATIGFSDTVVRYGASQIQTSGSPAPEVVLTGLGDVGPLAFDASGNLWVGDGTHNRFRIHKVPPLALAHSGTVIPVLSLDLQRSGSATGPLGGAAGLAFDASGNLWVAFGASGIIAKLTTSELAGSGETTLTPSVQIEAGGPKELAFDEAGNLWFAFNDGKLARLSPAQLASGEAPPDVVLDSSELGASHGVALYPAPANLPLFHRLP